ncbi:MAG: preprotein translocase subunit SecE [Armatimonadetes bacterium RBG_16_58_9]|nr:MAG: preprotein translocase subunit SecE [Armatimonadetes bacterium RBG_16_58_9]
MASGSAAKAAARPRGDGLLTRAMRFIRELLTRAMRFIRESYVETRYKSAWPTWTELRQFTVVVIFALCVVSLWIGGIDFLLGRITARLGQ